MTGATSTSAASTQPHFGKGRHNLYSSSLQFQHFLGQSRSFQIFELLEAFSLNVVGKLPPPLTDCSVLLTTFRNSNTNFGTLQLLKPQVLDRTEPDAPNNAERKKNAVLPTAVSWLERVRFLMKPEPCR